MTYKQAQAEGGQVRRGEHGTTAIFYTMLEKENDAGDTEHIPMLKTFTVFNVEQIDGLTLTAETVAPEVTFDPLPQAENLFRNTSSRKDKTPFSAPQTMRSGCRSVTFFLMTLIFTPPVCMNWCTGVVAKVGLAVR